MDEPRNRVVRAIIGGAIMALIAVLVVAAVRVLVFVVDPPVWWSVIFAFGLAGVMVQWITDRPEPEPPKQSDPE
jgi:hypothetical protein